MSVALLGIDERMTEFLKHLGLEDIGNIRRVIVDIGLREPVKAYVTYISAGAAFDLQFSKGEIEIVTVMVKSTATPDLRHRDDQEETAAHA